MNPPDNSLIRNFSKSAFKEVPLPPEISARFNIIEYIGLNDFGETFLLSEKASRALYVLKTCRSEETLICNEAELLYGLKHKGLPQYEQAIEYNGSRFVLRKFIDGKPLDEYVADISEASVLSEEDAVKSAIDIMLALCDVLEFLHSCPEPIIHRDIKPSNIIYNPETGDVTLIDFGISRRYLSDAETDTACFGTHKFAPPEQYGYAQTDCRTDIYSLGVVMRFLLTGRTDKSAGIADRALEKIVLKCTSFAPETRYRSAGALANALRNYKSRRTRRVFVAAACLLAVCAAVVAGYALRN
jgi:serine/threonine protein kinase